MASPSASIPQSISAPAPTSKLLQTICNFLIRRRILLSAILFTSLIVEDVLFGDRPRDWMSFRDPIGTLGFALVAAGLLLRSWAAGILRKDLELTTTGPYRLLRNPLYVGSFLMMFGFCALINDMNNWFFIAGPVLLVYIIKVRQEERLLSGLFPDQWHDYVRRTPRFFPRIARTDITCNWRLSQWLHAREYRAASCAMLALVAIKVWQSLDR